MEQFYWSQQTLIFYLLIMVAMLFIPKIFYNVRFKIGNSRSISIAPLFIFGVLLAVKGFATCGRDLVRGYKYNFESAISFAAVYDQGLEVGYKLLSVLIRNITADYQIYCFFIALLSLIPFYYLLKKYDKYSKIEYIALAFSSCYFFQGISLLRMYLACSICLLSFDALCNKNYKKGIMWVLCAGLIHRSALIMLIPCLVLLFNFSKKIVVILLGLILGIIYLFRGEIAYYFSNSSRYYVYGIGQEIFGMEVLLNYLPLIVFFVYIYKNKKYICEQSDENKESFRLLCVSFIWVLMGVFISLLHYPIPVFGRMLAYTMPIVFFVGFAMKLANIIWPKYYNYIQVIVVAYFLLRFWLYIISYYSADGIMPYTNCFGVQL